MNRTAYLPTYKHGVIVRERHERPVALMRKLKIVRYANMNIDQHLKVAQWHMEQARLHALSPDHKCGCPPNEHDQKAIDAVESGNIEEEHSCSV